MDTEEPKKKKPLHERITPFTYWLGSLLAAISIVITVVVAYKSRIDTKLDETNKKLAETDAKLVVTNDTLRVVRDRLRNVTSRLYHYEKDTSEKYNGEIRSISADRDAQVKKATDAQKKSNEIKKEKNDVQQKLDAERQRGGNNQVLIKKYEAQIQEDNDKIGKYERESKGYWKLIERYKNDSAINAKETQNLKDKNNDLQAKLFYRDGQEWERKAGKTWNPSKLNDYYDNARKCYLRAKSLGFDCETDFLRVSGKLKGK